MNKKDRINDYKCLLASKYKDKRYACSTELGVCHRGHRRADFIAFSMKGEIIIIECKSCLADYRSDHKWKDYLQYCNKFYFCMPESVYEKVKDDFKGLNIGVFAGYENESKVMFLRSLKGAKWRPMKNKVKREVYLRMAFRNAEFRKH